MDIASFEKFLQEIIKVGGKVDALGDSDTVTREKFKITVTSHSNFSKRYLKYFIKKYLKKHTLRDRLIYTASKKDRYIYELKYFNISENEGEEEHCFLELYFSFGKYKYCLRYFMKFDSFIYLMVVSPL
ncbi:hypothetical protein RYX36_009629 [Vicia faba]